MPKAVSFYSPEGQKQQSEIERQMVMAQLLMGQGRAQLSPTRFTPRESIAASLAPAITQSAGLLLGQRGQKKLEDLRQQEMAALLQRMGGGAPSSVPTPGVPAAATQGAGMTPGYGDGMRDPGVDPRPPAQSQLNPYGIDPTVAAQAYMADPAKYAEALMAAKKPTDLQRNINAAGFGPEQQQQAYAEALLPKDRSTDDEREWKGAVQRGEFSGGLQDWILAQKKAGATNVSVSGEKSLYTNLGEAQAKQYSDLYSQAQGAPEAVARTQRVRELLANNPYTGAAADWKLRVGKAAKAIGFDFAGDDVANTELLARELGQNALDSVKSSGLAGSQGLTEGERKFLMQVVGGTIELDAKTLGRVADLNERVARNSVKKWNATAGRLDQNQLRTLGMQRVELDEPKPAAASPPGGPRKISSDADYDSLPSGTEFIAPDGSRRRKP